MKKVNSLRQPADGGKNIEIISRHRFVKVAPDKIRLAGGLIKNKNLFQAMDILKFSNLSAAKPLLLNLKQALSQAKDKDILTDNLRVEIIKVDEGPKLKRWHPMSRGRAYPITKRTSHITLVLSEINPTINKQAEKKFEKAIKKSKSQTANPKPQTNQKKRNSKSKTKRV